MKKLKMQLFGSVCLTDGENVLDEETFRSNKLTRLLVYILINRKNILTHQKIIEEFWDEKSKNPEAALKNQIYLIRNALKKLGDETFILTMPGAYHWNPEIEVETDYEEFEYLIQELKQKSAAGGDNQKKMELCRRISDLYKDNVSGKVAHESWMLPKVVWYQASYMETMKIMCALMEKQGKWHEIELINRQLMHLEYFDEDVHCWLMKSLYGQKRYDMVRNHYEIACRTFYENLGTRHPEKLKVTYRELLQKTENTIMEMERLMVDVLEEKMTRGAYFCSYQIFRMLYQIDARRFERSGIAEYMLLFTLRLRGNSNVVDQMLMEGLNILEDSIRNSLRAGDVVSRYSRTQFVALLPMCNYESAVKVAERVQKNFRKAAGKNSIELSYELAELSASE